VGAGVIHIAGGGLGDGRGDARSRWGLTTRKQEMGDVEYVRNYFILSLSQNKC
jgi:hypothetical protein